MLTTRQKQVGEREKQRQLAKQKGGKDNEEVSWQGFLLIRSWFFPAVIQSGLPHNSRQYDLWLHEIFDD